MTNLRDRIMSKDARVGSGDFLKDRGYDDPEESRVKFTLSNEIALAIEDQSLTQVRAAEITGLRQPDLSRIVNGNVAEFSVWRLIRTLSLLGKDVEIGLHPARGDHGTVMAVSYDAEEPAAGMSMGAR